MGRNKIYHDYLRIESNDALSKDSLNRKRNSYAGHLINNGIKGGMRSSHQEKAEKQERLYYDCPNCLRGHLSFMNGT